MLPDGDPNPEFGSTPASPAAGESSSPPSEVAAAPVGEPAPELSPPAVPVADAAPAPQVAAEAPVEAPADEPEVEEEESFVPAEPLEFIDESANAEDMTTDWYILKVAVNREDSIRAALVRRIKMNGLERYFKEIVVPTEDIAEFTKTGKRRVVKKKLYPGYLLVNMSINDESWFVVRETAGIGDFTGAGGKPSPMNPRDVEAILRKSKLIAAEETQVKTAIPFKAGDRVRIREGNFQNFEGDIEAIDQANGRVTVLINIFGRPTPVEFPHWQIEMI